MAAVRSESTWPAYGTTPFSCNMPATIAAGDMLVLLVAASTTEDISVSGWTKLYSYSHPTDTNERQYIFYKTAAGGDTATVTASSTQAVWTTKCFAVSGVTKISAGTTPLTGTVSYGDTTFNPPSLTTSGFVGEVWIAAIFGRPGNAGNNPDLAAPSGYSGISTLPVGTGSSAEATAYLVKTVATENPGNFAMTVASSSYSNLFTTLATIALGNNSNSLFFGSNF